MQNNFNELLIKKEQFIEYVGQIYKYKIMDVKLKNIRTAIINEISALARKNTHRMKSLKYFSFSFKIRKAIIVMLAERLEVLGYLGPVKVKV